MNSIKRHLTICLALIMAMSLLCSAAFADSVYSVTYGTQDISGNVRHTGYVTALGSQEKNTLELKDDGSYVYTKLLTSSEEILNGAAIPEFEVAGAAEEPAAGEAAPAGAAAEGKLLFSWEPNNEGENKGSCTLDFYDNGSYVFAFPSFSVSEEGTWTWDSWNMTIIRADGVEFKAEMDADHALCFEYVAAISDQLRQNFIAPTSAWGTAFGGAGSYTPVSSASSGLTVKGFYTGAATKKTAEGNDYDVTMNIFLLSDGTAYIADVGPASTAVTLGTWTEDAVTAGSASAAIADGKLTWNEVETALTADLPADYAAADWAALIAEASKPSFEGPIVLCYVFTGTYTQDGDTVTLEVPTAVTWSENWGSLQNHGFKNCKGNENDKVWPKGESDKYFWAIDHFDGPYLIALSHPANEPDAAKADLTAMTIELNQGSMGFDYVIESAFD